MSGGDGISGGDGMPSVASSVPVVPHSTVGRLEVSTGATFAQSTDATVLGQSMKVWSTTGHLEMRNIHPYYWIRQCTVGGHNFIYFSM